MRKARIEREMARAGAGNRVEQQAGKDDGDPAGRDQPQLWADQPERERQGRARE